MSCSGAHFVPLLRAILKLLLKFDIRFMPTYIASSATNYLADLLSRGKFSEYLGRLTVWRQEARWLGKDFEDWMLHFRLFDRLERDFGPVAVSACADEHGRNSHTPRFWSAVDSCRRHHWGGLLVWANPPFTLIGAILAHFFRCKIAQPMGTALLILVPVWESDIWYKCIQKMPGTFLKVRRWERNADLFTAPPPIGGGGGRVFQGTTNWAVEVYLVSGDAMRDVVPQFFWDSV